ncbi:MAG: glycosyltransferase [Planctomycetes bacterium]|nr:glycosyltransferase [Planctomycetota bacterium]
MTIQPPFLQYLISSGILILCGDAMKGEKKHIAYLIDEMKVGGAQRHIEGLIERLPPEYCASVLCLEKSGPIGEELAGRGVPVIELHCPNLWSINGASTFFRLRRMLREEGVDLLHAFLGTACLIAPLVKSGNIKTVTSRRDTGFWMGKAFSTLAAMVASRADGITANSTAVKDAACRLEKIRPEKIEVIHNGIDVPEVTSHEARMKLRHSLGLDGNDIVITQVATLTPVKDHETAISALVRLAPEHPRLRWVFVGDGPRMEPLKHMAANMGVGRHLLFLGERQDVRDILMASDISVLTSRSEGFPNAVLEAMACGLPVVSTDCGGVNDMIEDSVNGMVVPVAAPESLAAAIEKLIENTGLADSLGSKARERIGAEFTWENTVGKTCALYERLLAGKGSE